MSITVQASGSGSGSGSGSAPISSQPASEITPVPVAAAPGEGALLGLKNCIIRCGGSVEWLLLALIAPCVASSTEYCCKYDRCVMQKWKITQWENRVGYQCSVRHVTCGRPADGACSSRCVILTCDGRGVGRYYMEMNSCNLIGMLRTGFSKQGCGRRDDGEYYCARQPDDREGGGGHYCDCRLVP